MSNPLLLSQANGVETITINGTQCNGKWNCVSATVNNLSGGGVGTVQNLFTVPPKSVITEVVAVCNSPFTGTSGACSVGLSGSLQQYIALADFPCCSGTSPNTFTTMSKGVGNGQTTASGQVYSDYVSNLSGNLVQASWTNHGGSVVSGQVTITAIYFTP